MQRNTQNLELQLLAFFFIFAIVRVLQMFVLLMVTLSSGLAQFAMHICEDEGVLIATDTCAELDNCCASDEEKMHCNTTFVYVVTAKFKQVVNETKFAVTFITLPIMPTIENPVHGFSYTSYQQISAILSPHERRFTGVFII